MKRLVTVNFICLILSLGPAGHLRGDEPVAPMKITLYPTPASTPALKYRLLPERLDQKPGNAAVHYGKVTAEETIFFGKQEIRDQVDDLQTAPLEKLRAAGMRIPGGGPEGAIQDDIRRGAHCRYCDWQLPIGDGPYYEMLLPEVQQIRHFGRILAAQARFQIAQAEFDAAVETLQAGYALGQHVSTGETIVNSLVGIAISEVMSTQILDFVQQPAAPNLYWALTTLPSPLFDMRSALDVERMGIELSFPELTDARTAKRSPDEWRALYHRIFLQEFDRIYGHDRSPKWPSPEELDARCQELMPLATKALVASGLPEEDVAAMPVYQVATIYSLLTFHELLDGAVRYFWLPYPQAAAGINHTIEQIKTEPPEIVPIAERTLPAIRTARGAIARADRGLAVLRVFEALRIYAASNDGRLPEGLEDITEVPVPVDPVTGEPFVYLRDGENALLQGPTFRDVPLNYEITMMRS